MAYGCADFPTGTDALGGSVPEILCSGCTDISSPIASCCAVNPSGDCLPGGESWQSIVSVAAHSELKTYTASNYVACSAISQAFSLCSLATPNFYQLPLSSQSGCLCSSSVLELEPKFTSLPFAVVASSCPDYLQTYEPTYAAGFSTTLVDLCSATGAGPAGSTPAVRRSISFSLFSPSPKHANPVPFTLSIFPSLLPSIFLFSCKYDPD
jgi:hypothetical protein